MAALLLAIPTSRPRSIADRACLPEALAVAAVCDDLTKFEEAAVQRVAVVGAVRTFAATVRSCSFEVERGARCRALRQRAKGPSPIVRCVPVVRGTCRQRELAERRATITADASSKRSCRKTVRDGVRHGRASSIRLPACNRRVVRIACFSGRHERAERQAFVVRAVLRVVAPAVRHHQIAVAIARWRRSRRTSVHRTTFWRVNNPAVMTDGSVVIEATRRESRGAGAGRNARSNADENKRKRGSQNSKAQHGNALRGARITLS